MPFALGGAAAGWLLVHPVAGALAFLVGYAAACWWYPLANCWCCRGGGKHRSRGGATFRRCSVCAGKGSWFRVGSRLLAAFWGRER